MVRVESFKNYLLIGIGGSALGPQFVANALGNPKTDRLKPFFFDNTDPDGMDRVLATIGTDLNRTLCIVISKSGGTKETRNGMLVAEDAFRRVGLDFGQHAVAVTMQGSELDKHAFINKWMDSFSDVGLGRRPNQRAFGCGIASGSTARN
jgi:glucose-6-phosphate isomerase